MIFKKERHRESDVSKLVNKKQGQANSPKIHGLVPFVKSRNQLRGFHTPGLCKTNHTEACSKI